MTKDIGPLGVITLIKILRLKNLFPLVLPITLVNSSFSLIHVLFGQKKTLGHAVVTIVDSRVILQ